MIEPLSASHSRIALSMTASKTAWRSNGRLLMTFRTCATAVCRSSASFVSLKSRTFSIASAPCSAKVSTSVTC